MRIFLIGPMGAGKSTVGRALARTLGLDFADCDTEIEQRTGADIPWILRLRVRTVSGTVRPGSSMT